MIDGYRLEKLCKKYNISLEKIINKNSLVLSRGNFDEIDEILNYLINDLGISPKNIEKCPSILYKNIDDIKDNVIFLKQKNVNFSSVVSCLHVLSTKNCDLQKTYNYVIQNYGIKVIRTTTSILGCPVEVIQEAENIGVPQKYVISVACSINWGSANINNIKNLLQSPEYKKYPHLFTSETFSSATIEDVREILNSEEYKNHPELFTSTTLSRTSLKDIQKLLQSEEYKMHPELFTSVTLGYSKIEDIKSVLNSEEYKNHPELFTSTTLAYAKLYDIIEILRSEEYKNYPHLFTSEVLARAKLSDIKEILKSEEFKKYPHLFTSETLANANLEKIQSMINSQEFKNHPELFTSTTLAHAKLEDIKEILQSEEYKNHPHLFKAETLARINLNDIQEILNLPCLKDSRYKKLITASILAKGKKMILKIPVLLQMAQEYHIDEYISSTFFLLSPRQNYAVINYLLDSGIPLIINNKLNSLIGKKGAVLSKKFGIDLKELMKKYPYEEKNTKGARK